MLILAYDTETTGLPVWNEPSEGPNQPHLVEIAALLIDTDTLSVRDAFSAIIRPDGWSWDENDEAFKAHGITMEQALAEGIPEADALAQYMALWLQADQRVGHNESFDQRILRIAIKRYGYGETSPLDSQEARDELADRFKAAPSYCTMNTAKAIMKLPATPAMVRSGKGKWFKPPNLNEAHQHFFGRPHEGAHRAGADTDACARLYFALTDPSRELPENLWPPQPVADLAKMDEFAAAGAATGEGVHDEAEQAFAQAQPTSNEQKPPQDDDYPVGEAAMRAEREQALNESRSAMLDKVQQAEGREEA